MMRQNKGNNEICLTPIQRFIRYRVQHYNPQIYWKRRNIVVDHQSRVPKIIKYYYLYYLKKCDAMNNASLGTHLGFGATFKAVPSFPHGLYGIVLSHNVSIGTGAVIFHQVTIGEGKNGAPQIGDYVTIGAGAKIIGNVRIGSHVTIGAGAVVTFDVPDHSIVRAAKGTVYERKEEN